MPEKRAWDKERERERKRAYRERKLLEATVPEASLAARELERALDDLPERPLEGLQPLPEPEAVQQRTLESYILECRALAAQEAERDLVAGVTGRLERAEVYARWRWDGVRAGTVAGL